MRNEIAAIASDPIDVGLSWRMLSWLVLAQVAVALVGRSLAPLGPLIAADLQLSNTQVGLLPSALFFGQMLVSIPSGLLVDRVGTKRLLLAVCSVLGLSYIFGSLSSSFVLLLILIMIGGMAYGTMHPVTNRGILYWFPVQRRGTAMGIKQMGITFGSALAAIALLPLAVATNWRVAMSAACLILLVIGVVSYRKYQERPIIKANPSIKEQSLLVNMLSVVRHRPLLLISFVAFILNGAQMSVNMYLIFFIGNELLFGLAIAGTMFVLSEVGGSIGRIVWGTISDTFFKGSRFAVMFMIIIIACLCSAMMAFLDADSPLWLLTILVLTLGFAVSGFNGLWMNIATELTPREQAGLASGVSLTIGSIGVMLIPPLFGLTVDLSGSFQVAWLFMAAAMVVASFILIVLRSKRSF